MLRRLAILLVSISTILVAAQASAKPSRSSVRASLNKKHTDSTERGERVVRQRQPDSWEIGFSWGQGVLRTLERGAESNDSPLPAVFHHENHPSVWGLHVGRLYGLTGHWSLGWELGYKDLGKTSGFFDHRRLAGANQRFSDRLLRAEGFDGLLRLDYALDRHWGVYGSFGAMVWQIHRTVVGNNGLSAATAGALDGDGSRTQMDPEYALGLRYAFRHVLLSLSYDRVMGSSSATQDAMAGQIIGTPAFYLSPTSSSVLLGLSVKLKGSRASRLSSDYDGTGWEIGFSWGQGVLRTLERGAESNDGFLPSVFHHENHPSVWGLHIGRMFGLSGHWSLGWELGYKDLGKTSGFFDNRRNVANQRFSDRLLRVEGFDGLLRLDYALDRHWGVYGSLGAMAWQIHRTVVGNNADPNTGALDGDASRTQMDPEYALGLRYAFRHVLLSLSYDRVMGSESGTQDNMGGSSNGTPTLYLSPTSSSVLLGLSVKLKGSRASRLSSDYDGTGWEVGFSWGQGVLRTLERGAESNDGTPGANSVFHHVNYPSVWGLHIARLFGLTGHWSLGWELGYKDLGKTSGFYDNRNANANQRFSDRLLRAEGFDGLLRIDYALDRHWGVYGSLGAMVWQIHRTVVGNNGIALGVGAIDGDASRTQMDPEYALGLRYAYGHVLLSLSYDRVMGSESGTQDNMAGQTTGTPTLYLSPTSSSVLLGLSVKLKGSRASRLSSDYDGTGWELGFSWGQGVLRTLERGEESNDANRPSVFHHENHPSVWGLHVAHMYGLTGHWSLGWELGYKDLGKTSGFFDNRANAAGRRFSDRLLRAEGFDGLLRLDYALDRYWGVYGSLGAMVWQIHRTVVGNNGRALDGDASRTQMDPEYALGLRYAFRHVLLSLSYDRVMGSESGTQDAMAGQTSGTPTLSLSPTSSSVLLGLSVKLKGSRATRLSSDYDGTGWEIGFSWGQGVLRTLERGAESNDGALSSVFHHVNYPSVWGLHIGRLYGLTGHWSLGWELGYKDLGKTSGFMDARGAGVGFGFSTRVLRAEGFDGLLCIDYALDRHWGVYGSLGAMVWQIHRTVVGNNGFALDGDASRTQMDPEYALGLRYAYRHVLLSLSYDRVMGSESGTQDNLAGNTLGTPTHYLSPTSSSVLLGLSIHFNV